MNSNTKIKNLQILEVPPGSDVHWDMWSNLANSDEPHEVDYWLLQMLPADTNFVDIGANIGNSALSALKANKCLRITSFEANFSLEKYLEKSKEFIKKNNGRFRFFLYGLGNEKKTIDLYVPKIDNWYVIGESSMLREHFDQATVSERLASYSKHGKWSLEKGQVLIERFDDIYENIFIEEPMSFFVKIDVEGFEDNVIDGMHEFIKKYNPGFLMEVNEQKSSCKKLLDLGYEPYHYDHANRLIRHGFNPDSLNAIYLNQSAIDTLHLSHKIIHKNKSIKFEDLSFLDEFAAHYSPIFIVGPERSGTHLVYRLLASHGICYEEPNLAVETHVFSRPDSFWTNDSELSASILSYLGGEENKKLFLDKIARFGVNRETILSAFKGKVTPSIWENEDLWRQTNADLLIKWFFYESDRHLKFVRIADKTNTQCCHVANILNVFPSSKIVFCLRNPLQILRSIFDRKTLESESAGVNRKDWLLQSDQDYMSYLDYIGKLYFSYRKVFGDKIFYMNYENLCGDSERTLRELSSYFNVDPPIENYMKPLGKDVSSLGGAKYTPNVLSTAIVRPDYIEKQNADSFMKLFNFMPNYYMAWIHSSNIS